VTERMRCKVTIGEEVCWISHLEFLHMISRTVRRADIPIRYSEGYNPRPMMSFAIGRPVGLASDEEFVDLHLKHSLRDESLLSRLNAAIPVGFSVVDVKQVPEKADSLASVINASKYKYRIEGTSMDLKRWQDAAEKFWLSDESIIIRSRRNKPDREVNIRPHVYSLEVSGGRGEEIVVISDMALGGANNVRPDELIRALYQMMNGDVENRFWPFVQVCRLCMYRREGDKKISPWNLI